MDKTRFATGQLLGHLVWGVRLISNADNVALEVGLEFAPGGAHVGQGGARDDDFFRGIRVWTELEADSGLIGGDAVASLFGGEERRGAVGEVELEVEEDFRCRRG